MTLHNILVDKCRHLMERVTSKTTLIPVLLPAIGVNGSVWMQDGSDVFAAAGLPF